MLTWKWTVGVGPIRAYGPGLAAFQNFKEQTLHHCDVAVAVDGADKVTQWAVNGDKDVCVPRLEKLRPEAARG